jgi:hypothetical protein
MLFQSDFQTEMKARKKYRFLVGVLYAGSKFALNRLEIDQASFFKLFSLYAVLC